jgi:hypothetical protein
MTADIAMWTALEAVKAKPARRVGKARKDAPSERVVQRQIVKALRALGIMAIHVPNGAYLNGDATARMKQSAALVADGVLVGFPDILAISRDGRLGLLEIKKEGGKVSAEQERVLALLATRRVPLEVVCTLDAALDALKRWGFLCP